MKIHEGRIENLLRMVVELLRIDFPHSLKRRVELRCNK